MNTVIKVENLAKMYRLGTIGSGTIRDDLHRWWASVRGKEDPLAKVDKKRHSVTGGHAQETIWALRDVSFEVAQGEVLGVIGRNGAGKSTLLKILSRVTAPSAGVVRAKGRIASLLEVGTGFHPELTGRDNIFLNGALLGMTKQEIARKFDEIVAFSEIEQFIDTPVKRYSSGMYVRLAFAVAAHLEPEILIVDEVLAVGDAEFQKKCLGKMGDVAKHGRTVLFVSHNMGAITRLCSRAILIERGSLQFDGSAEAASSRYLATIGTKLGGRVWGEDSAPGDQTAKLFGVHVTQQGRTVETVDIRFPVSINVEFVNAKPQADLLCALSLFNDQGVHLLTAADFDNKESRYRPGRFTAEFIFPGNLFAEGVIRICPEVSTRAPVYQIHFCEQEVAAFQVIDNGEPGSLRADWGRPIPGAMRPHIEWNIRESQGGKSA